MNDAASQGRVEPEAESTGLAIPCELRMAPGWVAARRWAQLLRSLLLTGFLVIGYLFLRAAKDWPEYLELGLGALLALLILLRFVVGLIWPGLLRRRCRYEILEDRVIVTRGVLHRSTTTVPRSRIQHIELSEGPIARRYRIADLSLHTAGTVAASISLDGLPRPIAAELRDILIEEQGDGGV